MLRFATVFYPLVMLTLINLVDIFKIVSCLNNIIQNQISLHSIQFILTFFPVFVKVPHSIIRNHVKGIERIVLTSFQISSPI